MVTKPSSQVMKQVKQGSNHQTCERENKKKQNKTKQNHTANGYLKLRSGVSWSTSYTSFSCHRESRKEGTAGILPSCPDQAQQRSRTADVSKNCQQEFSPAGFCHFPHNAIGSKWGAHVSLTLVEHELWRRKNNSPSSLWWVLSWEPPFCRTPHKWYGGQVRCVRLGRLNVLHCGHCDSRWPLIGLTCLFSLKAKFDSPQASWCISWALDMVCFTKENPVSAVEPGSRIFQTYPWPPEVPRK